MYIPKNDPKNDPKNLKRQEQILKIIKEEADISISRLAEILSVSYATIKRDISKLAEMNKLKRIGPKKGGHWEIIVDE